ncbi:hypothetical protein QYE76_014169 [Lolium multiflorum]|uniref:DUF4371 domain-containing protein n=1 Tax=Lolium multiflorum TaxID=4521 RepID=A0AAD8X7W8_LOLMU|nr:hypothetical protein QYE76_014169 [Lolium multiflorum]
MCMAPDTKDPPVDTLLFTCCSLSGGPLAFQGHHGPVYQIIVKSIIDVIGGDVFCLLVDESADVSDKEQMAVVLRYVDNFGAIKERLIEFIDRFNEVNSDLLTRIAAFSPKDSFNAFKVESLVDLAKSYPDDFDSITLKDLAHELSIYIDNVRADERFVGLKTIFELAKLMASTKKYVAFRLVYRGSPTFFAVVTGAYSRVGGQAASTRRVRCGNCDVGARSINQQ